MKIKKLEARNYRLLKKIEIKLDDIMTLIVGKNNSGKTSLMELLITISSKGKTITFNDYPLTDRKDLYESIKKFLKTEIKYEELLSKIYTPFVRITVDYSTELETEDLGNLSEFIIDLDVDKTEAIIEVQYQVNISEDTFKNIFSEVNIQDEQKSIDQIKEILQKKYEKMLVLKVKAINPNDESDILIKTQEDFKRLFPIYKIRAERDMNESENGNISPLSPLLNKIFNEDVEKMYPEIENSIKELKSLIEQTNLKSQEEADKILSNIVSKAIGFGYPNIEELQLSAQTKMVLEEQIKRNTDLSYKDNDLFETLPSTYNGLGYKNIIKIELELAQISKEIKIMENSSLPILFIEEPESHMHPQLQQRFAEFISEYLKKMEIENIQIIVTTHSPHLSNAVEFNQIRYVQKNKNSVIYKDLNDFAEKDNNFEFLQKYLNVTKCDLFFADKVILVEGSSESLLIPDMILKLKNSNAFGEEYKPTLDSQYYTILEVGGAYAHKFLPFVKFLGTPTLIITDIDSVKKNANNREEKCHVSVGETTSNGAIKEWVKKVLGKDDDYEVTLEDVKSLSDEQKKDELCCITYQTPENGLCGRSLEEAIKNVNRNLFGINNPAEEIDIDFNANSEKKTEFALDLLLKNYTIPKYISDGLIWLNNKKLYEEVSDNEQ